MSSPPSTPPAPEGAAATDRPASDARPTSSHSSSNDAATGSDVAAESSTAARERTDTAEHDRGGEHGGSHRSDGSFVSHASSTTNRCGPSSPALAARLPVMPACRSPKLTFCLSALPLSDSPVALPQAVRNDGRPAAQGVGRVWRGRPLAAAAQPAPHRPAAVLRPRRSRRRHVRPPIRTPPLRALLAHEC